MIRLAIRWNIPNVAEDMINSIRVNYTQKEQEKKQEEIFQLMELALIYHATEIFELLIDGFDSNSLDKFLTARRLYFLYNFRNEVSFYSILF